jgi:hypothetical protein
MFTKYNNYNNDCSYSQTMYLMYLSLGYGMTLPKKIGPGCIPFWFPLLIVWWCHKFRTHWTGVGWGLRQFWLVVQGAGAYLASD